MGESGRGARGTMSLELWVEGKNDASSLDDASDLMAGALPPIIRRTFEHLTRTQNSPVPIFEPEGASVKRLDSELKGILRLPLPRGTSRRISNWAAKLLLAFEQRRRSNPHVI